MAEKKSRGKSAKKEISRALAGQLLLVSDLLKEKGYARGVEVADGLGLSRPTITRSMQGLAKQGYVEYERYRGIGLTAAGEREAEKARGRQRSVHAFLLAAGMKEEDAARAARQIEPCCTDAALEAFASAAGKLRRKK